MNIRTFLAKRAVPVLTVVQVLLDVPPVVLTFRLYRLAQRAETLIGHWPVAMVNDPKWIGPNDGVYQHLYDVADRVDAVTFYGFFVSLIVMAIAFRRYRRRTRLLQAGLFVIAWGLLWFNPWGLLPWWLD